MTTIAVDQRPFRTLDDLKARNRWAGQHWFDRDTLKFFSSRVSEKIYPTADGAFFVSSERDREYPRAWTVRFMALDGTTSTVGEFQQYGSRTGAHRAAAKAADRAAKTDGEARESTH